MEFEPFFTCPSIYDPVLSSIGKQSMHKLLKLFMVLTSDCEYLSENFFIVPFPLKNPVLGNLFLGHTHLYPIGNLSNFVFWLVHKAINKSRTLPRCCCFEHTFHKMPLISFLIFLIVLIDDWMLDNFICDFINCQTLQILTPIFPILVFVGVFLLFCLPFCKRVLHKSYLIECKQQEGI